MISNDEITTEVLGRVAVQECLKYKKKMVYCVKTLEM